MKKIIFYQNLSKIIFQKTFFFWYREIILIFLEMILRHREITLRRLETSWDVLRHRETSWDIMRQRWDVLRHRETSWDIVRRLETSWDIVRRLETKLRRLKTKLRRETFWDVRRVSAILWILSCDNCNILCIIIEKRDVLFKLGCEVGVLDSMFAFNSIEKTNLVYSFTEKDIPDRVLSVREAIRMLSVGHGQGVLKCNCRTGKCLSGRCSCAKAYPSQKCNSRCHGGCENKNCKNKA